MRYMTKLIISIVLLLAVGFGISGTLLISSSFDAAVAEEKDRSLSSYKTACNTLSVLSSLRGTAYIDMSRALSQLKEQNSYIWDALSLKNGDVSIYADGAEKLTANELEVTDGGKCVYTIYSEGERHYMQIASIMLSGDIRLRIEGRYDISSAFAARSTQIGIYFKIYIVVVSCGIIISVAISYALTRRLARLTKAVKRISAGDLSIRSNIKSADEIGLLSREFDAMTEKLSQNIEHLEDEMQRQESFMGAFAHEIKTPMTSIIGYSDLLRQDTLNQRERIAAASYIFSEGQRLEKLSFKLLDMILLKKDALTFKKVDLPLFISVIVLSQKRFMRERGIALSFRCGSGTAFFDPDLVKSLVLNLIDNAAKATPEGGAITVTASETADGCRISVSDTGCGMESAELARITEAFYRVDKSRSRKQGGAGLGLSLCRLIAEVHGGTLNFDSAPGVGTTVTAELHTLKEAAMLE